MLKRTILAILLSVIVLAPVRNASAAETPFVGLEIQGMTPLIADALGFEHASGILVRDISLDGPGVTAGLKRGDVIVKVNEKSVTTIAQLVKEIVRSKVGQTISLSVIRAGKTQKLSMTLAKKPEAWKKGKDAFASIPAFGLTLSSLSDKARAQFKTRWASRGVVVTITPEGEAQAIRRGDVIVQVDQKPVWLPRQVLDIVRHVKNSGRMGVLFLIDRQGSYHYVLQPFK